VAHRYYWLQIAAAAAWLAWVVVILHMPVPLSVTLAWEAVPGARGYEVFLCEADAPDREASRWRVAQTTEAQAAIRLPAWGDYVAGVRTVVRDGTQTRYSAVAWSDAWAAVEHAPFVLRSPTVVGQWLQK
jgi:hypothetical protein